MKIYDEIEQLFKNSQKENDMDSIDWLTPPDFILDNAVKTVNDKKKRRRGYIFLFVGIIAFTVIGSLLTRLNNKLITLKEHVNQIDKSIDESEITYPQTDVIERVAKEGNVFENNTEESIIADPSPRETLRGSLLNTEEPPNNVSFVTIESERNSLEIGQITQPANKLNANSTMPMLEKLNQLHNTELIRQLKKLEVFSPKELINDRAIKINISLFEDSKPLRKTHKNTIYVFGGANMSTLKMTNVSTNNPDLTEYDNYYLGYQLGIGSDFNVNKKWNLTTTISYNSFQNQSSYLSNELYQKSNEETQLDGSISYKSNFDINSPLINTNEEFLINVDNLSIEQDHIIVNSTKIKERINVLRMAIGLKYSLINLDKLDVGISAGVSASTIVNLNNKYNSVVTYEELEMMKKEYKVDELDMVNRFFLSSLASIGIDYKLNSSWSVNFNGGYEKSLSSIRKFDDLNPTKTSLVNFDFNLGFKFRF